MIFASTEDYARTTRRDSGAVSVVICEDEFLAEETCRHILARGFGRIVAVGPGAETAEAADPENIAAISESVAGASHLAGLLNKLLETLRDRWVLVSFNGEFPVFPFSETRSVTDFTEFMRSERRGACASYTIDLYSDRLIDGDAPDLTDVYFDAEGWYGFDRSDGLVDVYGGLGWRFEEYSPVSMSRVNRPALFYSNGDVSVRPDLWLSDETLNTISCPWHNNPTMALMSFRRTRRLLSHPNFRGAIDTLMWPNSRRFEWRSEQLASLGLIEAGQWI